MRDDKPMEEQVRELLAGVKYPGFPRDIVSLGMVAAIALEGDEVHVELRLPGGRNEAPAELRGAIATALAPLGRTVALRIARPAAAPSAPAAAPVPAQPVALPGVRSVLAVSSAKGGVGKSTIATNLACAFAAQGLATGLLDADVYGPSLPILMGTEERPHAAGGNRFHPVERYGVRCISMGFFLDDSSPVIWRGPMVSGLVRQFLADCVWGELDVLVIDLPPGTGDAQLTLVQQVSLAGALIVTTPQEVASRDVLRGVAMFRQVQVPILGVVENMSVFVCSECGEREEIFGRGGGEAVARAAGAPLLASLPIDAELRAGGDAGRPIVLSLGSPTGRAIAALAARLASELGLGAERALASE